ncbi:hypothetical protein SAMN02745218_00964 [Desulfofundulus australicus DSM 11792]|uniref:Uncharacterized protein n=2 Tax=Desulfofundulus australicus TaxID=1566 RepID=A0A1M4X2Z2_9FIRM|nr:hypothetical protein SAMN02745218_00964 [Desulfofundulus australicus DSM 11792]
MSEQLLKEILGELKALNQCVGNMDQRIGNVEQRIGSLEQGQEELARRMERMEQRISNVEQGQQELVKRVSGLEQGQQELAGRMERMEALIENEIIDKIRALFDARAVHMDYFVSIRNSVARIEERVEHLARRQVETFIKLEEHDREIRLLRLEMSGH